MIANINMMKLLEDEKVSTSRVKILINRVDPVSGERRDQPPSDLSPAISTERDTPHAFTLRKNVYEEVDRNDGEIEISSPDLSALLLSLLRHYPYHTFQGPPTIINSPYEGLILNWEKLEQATKEESEVETDQQTRSDLRLLLDTIASGSGDPKLDKYFKSRTSNKEQKSVTFETLWTMFPPGTLIYGRPFQ